MKNNKIIKYFIDSYQELKKVTWPTRSQLIRDTLTVVISSAIATAFVAVIDLGLSNLIEYFVSSKG